MMLGLDLGLRTVLGQWRASLLSVLIVLSVTAPILILWGLKNGTWTALTDELRSDPRNLEIRLVGDGRLGAGELGAIAALPGLGFLQPTTRALAARAFLSRGDGSGREPVALLPSGPGDPLAGRSAVPVPGPGEVVLSARAAGALNLAVGDRARLSTQRENGARRFADEVRVVGILSPELVAGAQVLLDPALLDDVEAFLDGFTVPRLGIPGRSLTERHAAPSSARLYASRVEAVPALAEAIEALGYSVLSRAAEIDRLLRIGARLDALMAMLGVLLIAGCGAATGANVLAVFDRQARNIALLRLMGAGRGTVFLFVLGFGLATGAAGLIGALSLFGAGCAAINRWFPLGLGLGRQSCVLEAPQLLGASVATLALVLLVTLFAARRFAVLSPAGALRVE